MHIPEAKSCNSMENGQQPSGPTVLDRWQTRTNHIGAVFVVAIHQSKYADSSFLGAREGCVGFCIIL